MEGNIVKAATILGSSIVLSSLLLGIGGWISTERIARTAQRSAEINADAIARGPSNTRVSLAEPIRLSMPDLVKVGFEPRLPVAIQLENAMNRNNGTRAQFEIQLGKP